MSSKSNPVTPTLRCGLISMVPSASATKASVYKAGNNSYETQNTSTTLYKDTCNGSKNTTRYAETYKAEDFVDGRSGNSGYKEEAIFQKTHRVNDKAQGFTKETQTRVKVKETITYHDNAKDYDYYRGGASSLGYKNDDGGDNNYDSGDDYYDSGDDHY